MESNTRRFGHYRTSNPFLHDHLASKGFKPNTNFTEIVPKTGRMILFFPCSGELREAVEEFRAKG